MASRRAQVAAAGVAIVLVVAVVGLLVLGQKPATVVGPTPSPLATSTAPATSPSPTGPASPSPSAPAGDPLLGLDGRFTILLLGSDSRGSNPGDRTDTMMLVSVAPPDGSISVVSIPRDTARFPLPDGTVFPDKLNALYGIEIRRVGRNDAGTELRRIIGEGLGVEIDAYVLIGLVGLTTLVDRIGGVDVTLDAAVRDPLYWTNQGTQGIFFPAGKNHLNGDRALIFARTRKGDSDFQRVRRQQQLVLATARKVLQRGAEALPPLLEITRQWVKTDLSFAQAASIFELVAAADLDTVKTDVLGPRYADKIPGTVNYQLRIDDVRALIDRWFAPLPGSPAAGGSTASQAP